VIIDQFEVKQLRPDAKSWIRPEKT